MVKLHTNPDNVFKELNLIINTAHLIAICSLQVKVNIFIFCKKKKKKIQGSPPHLIIHFQV